MPIPIPFTKTISVGPDVIDYFDHVNNLVYIQWVLIISKEHWMTVSPDDIRKIYGWMILKHNVQYRAQAKLHDILQIKTWIEDCSTVTSTRRTTITDLNTQKLIFESEAQWCLVSLDTQKPIRIPDDLLKPYYKDL